MDIKETKSSPTDIQANIGKRIREIRTKLGLSIRKLAERAGISYLTMQRIETDRTSPSVLLLAQIAACLNYPITSLLTKQRQSVVHIKAEDQNTIATKRLIVKLAAPKGMVNKNISVVHGKAQKGELVGGHKHPGFELVYVLKGRAVYKQGNRKYELDEGDLIFFDGAEWHEVMALEPHEWVGTQFYSDRIDLRETDSPSEDDVP